VIEPSEGIGHEAKENRAGVAAATSHPDVSMISDHGDIGMCFSGG
jgi:hypothetical protein